MRLYELLARAEATPTAILSGDRHFAAIYRVPLGDGRMLWEVTSSSLNRPWKNAKESGPNLEGPPYTGENFGTVEIDWQARRAVLAVHDMEGNRVQEVALDLGIGRVVSDMAAPDDLRAVGHQLRRQPRRRQDRRQVQARLPPGNPRPRFQQVDPPDQLVEPANP